MFQKFYSKMLAKRLVQQNSASDDAEAGMISKLKVSSSPSRLLIICVLHLSLSCLQQACGFEYTSKLQRMFQDMSLSKDLNERFKQHVSMGDTPLDSQYGLCPLFLCSYPCSLTSSITCSLTTQFNHLLTHSPVQSLAHSLTSSIT